jgi:hypothetical protein
VEEEHLIHHGYKSNLRLYEMLQRGEKLLMAFGRKIKN